MKSKHYLTFAAAAFFTLPALAAPVSVSDGALGFAVNFPEAPKKEAAEPCDGIDGCTFTRWEISRFDREKEDCSFKVTVGQFGFPADGQFDNPVGLLNYTVESTLREDTEILSESDLSSGRVFGREVLANSSYDYFGPAPALTRQHLKVLIRGNKLYIAEAECDRNAPAAEARAFLSSFRLY
ncbi:hypothetical protein [Gimibacter soli]|uniref:Uncharacterized protein n=1 Tax=Gimibacter soli TaxID=3024400 RepID=A0AAE9XNX7_9PROT|nr:hypothetical protein [Gimibacter soli]WCL54492.1 hypothetical protein PH603_01810 [Gimibacter soli]